MGSENEEYADWRGKKVDPKRHGGIRVAALACGNLHAYIN